MSFRQKPLLLVLWVWMAACVSTAQGGIDICQDKLETETLDGKKQHGIAVISSQNLLYTASAKQAIALAMALSLCHITPTFILMAPHVRSYKSLA